MSHEPLFVVIVAYVLSEDDNVPVENVLPSAKISELLPMYTEPCALILPDTVNVVVGFDVPIPTLPPSLTVNTTLLAATVPS